MALFGNQVFVQRCWVANIDVHAWFIDNAQYVEKLMVIMNELRLYARYIRIIGNMYCIETTDIKVNNHITIIINKQKYRKPSKNDNCRKYYFILKFL